MPSAISRFALVLATMQIACVFVVAQEAKDQVAGKAGVTAIPALAYFDQKDIDQDGRYVLVGRLSLGRQFLGTRVTPPYRDVVRFHFFNGDELKFSSFTDQAMEDRLAKSIAHGRSVPAVLTTQVDRKIVGHDGINRSERLVTKVESYKLISAESILGPAKTEGFGEVEFERFKAALDPDFEKDGIAVTLGKITVRSKVTPRGSALSIQGVRVFNATAKPVTIEVTDLTIQQDGVSQKCTLSPRCRTPQSWQVEASSWSDGVYQQGKMPANLWTFDRPKPIKWGTKVEVKLTFKLNGNEPVTVTQVVQPI